MTNTTNEKDFTTVRVPTFVNAYLNKQKELGYDKGDVMATAIAIFECVFNNKVSFGMTKENILQLRALESMREEMQKKGASVEELAGIDVAIKSVREIQQRYREKEVKPSEVILEAEIPDEQTTDR